MYVYLKMLSKYYKSKWIFEDSRKITRAAYGDHIRGLQNDMKVSSVPLFHGNSSWKLVLLFSQIRSIKSNCKCTVSSIYYLKDRVQRSNKSNLKIAKFRHFFNRNCVHTRIHIHIYIRIYIYIFVHKM